MLKIDDLPSLSGPLEIQSDINSTTSNDTAPENATGNDIPLKIECFNREVTKNTISTRQSRLRSVAAETGILKRLLNNC